MKEPLSKTFKLKLEYSGDRLYAFADGKLLSFKDEEVFVKCAGSDPERGLHGLMEVLGAKDERSWEGNFTITFE